MLLVGPFLSSLLTLCVLDLASYGLHTKKWVILNHVGPAALSSSVVRR